MKPANYRKVLVEVFLVILFAVTALAQPGGQMSQQARELADYIKQNYTKSEVMIPMRDGVKLFVCIYEPKDKSQKYPIMFDRTPYSVGPYGADNYKASLGPDDLFAREGYIFVYGDVRGRYMSEGVYEDVRPYIPNKTGNQIDETTDTFDTVDWLIKNVANNNGRVGVYGISYPGFYTSMAGIDGHPAIKAISPQAPVSDWFHGDDNHHNGALFLAQNFSFFTGFGQPRPTPIANNNYVKPFNYGTQDGYQFYLQAGGLKNFGDVYEQKLG
ncbi:MAG TPA: CocE/NonD family hydrolase, partial [Pyrinomonadaceae bacterium]|nr:CocE/NonD family hydrolase [Pyrinomonadaceae bacterium]